MRELVPLHLLNPGETADIGHVSGSPDAVHRLSELGLRGGVTVEMVQRGTPCVIRLDGQKLCFRSDDVLQVLVKPGAAR
ncbi:MAG TPA: FeoA family protein [Pirellulales bacterium]|jgi:Fe2+ transport system protein FeoA|nr:FeoA family protein [Pirellulales bacterium]